MSAQHIPSPKLRDAPARNRADDAPRRAPAVRAFGRDDFDRDVWCVLGLPVDMSDVAGAAMSVETAVRDRARLSFVTPNVNWLVRALKDPAARTEIINADLSLADGAPLALLARALGAPLRARCAGSDLFEALRARPGFAGRRMRVYFFGGRDGAAEAAAAAIDAEGRGMEAAGWMNPGFGDVASMSTPEIIEAINEAAPDFIVVSLGAAKGQAWIERNKDKLDAPVMSHLGAVVDFTAGAVARAPAAVSRFGLEWAWRIKEEPALWRRYLRDGAALIGLCAARALPQYFAGKKKGGEAASAQVETTAAETAVTLAGDISAAGLDPVRRAFRQASAEAPNGRVILDFTAVGSVDRAFLGQALMLEKALNLRGGQILVRGLSKSLARLLKANAIEYAAVPAHAEKDLLAPIYEETDNSLANAG